MSLSAAAVAIVLGAGAMACSSIPDVTFSDAGASSDTNMNLDAGRAADASDGADAATATPQWSCPGNPPPKGVGVCCEKTLCLNCSASHCKSCRDEDCESGQVCCGRVGSAQAVDCRRAASSCP